MDFETHKCSAENEGNYFPRNLLFFHNICQFLPESESIKRIHYKKIFIYSIFQVEFMKIYDAILRKLFELSVTKCVTECVFLSFVPHARSFSRYFSVDGNDDDADSRKHPHAIDKSANERW